MVGGSWGRGEGARENSCLMDPIRLSVQSKLRWSSCPGMRPNCCSIFSLSRVLLRPARSAWAPGSAARHGTEPLVCKTGRKEALMQGLCIADGEGTWNVNEDGSLKHAFMVS